MLPQMVSRRHEKISLDALFSACQSNRHEKCAWLICPVSWDEEPAFVLVDPPCLDKW
jgi:hypothetical protein